MVTMLASSVVDHGFEFWSGQRIKLLGGGGSNVMVTMLASSVVDHGFEFWSGQKTRQLGGGDSVIISMRALSVVDSKIGDCFCHLI